MRQRLLIVVLAFMLCMAVAPLASGQNPGPDMAFVSDVTVADDTRVAASSLFEKTWLVQNVGSTDWTANYGLAFLKGNAFGAMPRVQVGRVVKPGESTDLTVSMQAPAVPGRYTSWWQMRDESGQLFGQPVYVRIVVVEADELGAAAARIDPESGTGTVPARPASTLTVVNPYGAWIWSAPKGQHDEGDVLLCGTYPVLQQSADGDWAQVRADARTVWVYSGVHSGTRSNIETIAAEAAPTAVPRLAAANAATQELLYVATQDARRAVEMWKARIEWYEEQLHPGSALAANDVPGATKGPGAIYSVIDAQTSDMMARLPYNLCEPILHIQHLGVFRPGSPPMGMAGPPVPRGVEALTDNAGEAEIRYDYLVASNPNFPVPADQWARVSRWALLGALAHEGKHIMARNGQNHQEAVEAQKQILLIGAQTLRSEGDEPGAALLERLASVVRSGTGNPVTGTF